MGDDFNVEEMRKKRRVSYHHEQPFKLVSDTLDEMDQLEALYRKLGELADMLMVDEESTSQIVMDSGLDSCIDLGELPNNRKRITTIDEDFIDVYAIFNKNEIDNKFEMISVLDHFITYLLPDAYTQYLPYQQPVLSLTEKDKINLKPYKESIIPFLHDLWTDQKANPLFYEYFNDMEDSLLRPYMSKQVRLQIEAYSFGESNEPGRILELLLELGTLNYGDIIHVPFTASEIQVFDKMLLRTGSFHEPKDFIPVISEVSSRLRGRTRIDCKRYFKDAYDINVLMQYKILDSVGLHQSRMYKNNSKVIKIVKPDENKNIVHSIIKPHYNILSKDKMINVYSQGSVMRGREVMLPGNYDEVIREKRYMDCECIFSTSFGDTINELCFGTSENTSHLVVCAYENTVGDPSFPIIFDLNTYTWTPLIEDDLETTDARFTCDGSKFITTNKSGIVYVFENDSSLYWKFDTNIAEIDHTVLHPNNPNIFVTSSKNQAGHNILRICNIANKSYAGIIPVHGKKDLLDVEFSRSNEFSNYFGVGMVNSKFRLLSFGEGDINIVRNVNIQHKKSVVCVRSIPDSSFLKSCISYSEGRCVETIAGGNKIFASDCIHFLDIRSIESVAPLDISNIPVIKSYSNLRGDHCVLDFSYSPCGMYLQTAGSDNCYCLFDIRNLDQGPVSVFEHDVVRNDIDSECYEWSNDGYLFTGCNDGSVRIWDVRRNACDALVGKLEGVEGSVRTISVSHDGQNIAVGTIHGQFSIFSK